MMLGGYSGSAPGDQTWVILMQGKHLMCYHSTSALLVLYQETKSMFLNLKFKFTFIYIYIYI